MYANKGQVKRRMGSEFQKFPEGAIFLRASSYERESKADSDFYTH